MKWLRPRLYVLLLLIGFAAGCQSHAGPAAASGHDAAQTSSSGHHYSSCGLRRVNPEKHRSRAQAERYARRALRCALRHHRKVYWPYPGDRVCLTSDLRLNASDGTVGAGIQGAPVRLTMTPGQVRSFRVQVTNAGSVTETLALRIENTYPYCSDVLPPSWVVVGKSLSLGTGRSAWMTGSAVVPADALRGTWHSDVVVTASAGTVTGSANFGAGAATPIKITVH